MPESMQDIKRRMKSVDSIEHVTNAMKLVSAAKLRRAKATFEKTNEFSHYIINSIAEVFNNASEVPEKYLEGNREIKKTCYIIVSSSRGFCGSFNMNIIREAEAMMTEDEGDSTIIAVGTKAKDYFQKRGFEILKEYSEPPEDISFLPFELPPDITILFSSIPSSSAFSFSHVQQRRDRQDSTHLYRIHQYP